MSINAFLFKATHTKKSKYFQTLKVCSDIMPLLHFCLGKFAGVCTNCDNRELFLLYFLLSFSLCVLVSFLILCTTVGL